MKDLMIQFVTLTFLMLLKKFLQKKDWCTIQQKNQRILMYIPMGTIFTLMRYTNRFPRWETDTFINYLDPKDEEIHKIVVKRMRSRINERKIDAMSFMEEYDFVKEGIVIIYPFISRDHYYQSI